MEIPRKTKPVISTWSKCARLLRRAAAAFAAVVGVFLGGFLWEEISPIAYGVVFIIVASTPLLLKLTFWKKLLWLLPVVFFRVLGKILIKVFGSHALERLFRRYGLLEQRYAKAMSGVKETKAKCVARWKRLSRQTQAHLILLFLPFLGLIAIAVLIIEILRFRVLQMVIEKLLQKSVQDRVQQGVDAVALKVSQVKGATHATAETANRVTHAAIDEAVEQVVGENENHEATCKASSAVDTCSDMNNVGTEARSTTVGKDGSS